MISIRSNADLQRALASPLDPTLRCLLLTRRDQLLDDENLELSEIVHFIVVRGSDSLAAVEAEAAFPFGTGVVDGRRFPERGFVAPFEYVERHGRWLEAVTILDDEGFALVLFVADCVCTDPDLRLLLRRALT